jgi:hypothetical protein
MDEITLLKDEILKLKLENERFKIHIINLEDDLARLIRDNYGSTPLVNYKERVNKRVAPYMSVKDSHEIGRKKLKTIVYPSYVHESDSEQSESSQSYDSE